MAAGCGADRTSKPDPGDGTPCRDTPDLLLDFYVYALESEDIDLYAEALHDKFTFVFSDAVADSLGVPPGSVRWGKESELDAVRGIFEDPDITSIEMDLPKAEGWVPAQIIVEPDSTIYGLFARTEPETRITIEEPDAEPFTLVYEASYYDMLVVGDPKFPDENLWVIIEIKEVLKNPGSAGLRQDLRLLPQKHPASEAYAELRQSLLMPHRSR
jgi:hypothetical protein